MCMSSSSPPPPPPPPETASKEVGKAAKEARRRERKRLASEKGRDRTILSAPGLLSSARTSQSTLLGR